MAPPELAKTNGGLTELAAIIDEIGRDTKLKTALANTPTPQRPPEAPEGDQPPVGGVDDLLGQ